MNKITLGLFVCFVLLESASGLNCYSCSGPTCEKETRTWGKRVCGEIGTIPDDRVAVCVKIKYKDQSMSKMMVERKCAVTETKDGNPDYHCTIPNGEIVECPVCTTDLCNSATNFGFSLLTFSGVLVVYLEPKLL